MRNRQDHLLALLAGVLVSAALSAWTIDRRYAHPDTRVTPLTIVKEGLGLVAQRYMDDLERKYGKKRYSFLDEETLIRDFFQDERDGYFVDVGASHYEKLSNTYYLEKNLGWKGVGIDAQDRYAADYPHYRPSTKYLVYFVGDKEGSGKQVEFLVDLENEYLSSGVDGAIIHASKKIVVPSITLDELLEREGIAKIDFVSMDIEDGEPAALSAFSIQRWKPRLLCVEMHAGGRSAIQSYFSRNGYVQFVSYSVLDRLNGYFAPTGGPDARREEERLRSWGQEVARLKEEEAHTLAGRQD